MDNFINFGGASVDHTHIISVEQIVSRWDPPEPQKVLGTKIMLSNGGSIQVRLQPQEVLRRIREARNSPRPTPMEEK